MIQEKKIFHIYWLFQVIQVITFILSFFFFSLLIELIDSFQVLDLLYFNILLNVVSKKNIYIYSWCFLKKKLLFLKEKLTTVKHDESILFFKT